MRTGFLTHGSRLPLALAGPIVALAWSSSPLAAAPAAVESILASHCAACHSGAQAAGGLDLAALDFPPVDAVDAERWTKVHDRVARGEMPPDGAPRPDPAALDDFVQVLNDALTADDSERQQREGRGRVRRLSRVEFETTLSDLLHVPLDIQSLLPVDGRGEGIDTVGAALNVSSVQMEAYLEALDRALDKATTLYEKPERKLRRLSYLDIRKQGTDKAYVMRDDGIELLGAESFARLDATLHQYTVPFPGRYQIRISAAARRSSEPIVMILRTGGTGYKESNHVPRRVLAYFTVRGGDPHTFEWKGWLERGEFLHIYPANLPPLRFNKGFVGAQATYQGPGLLVRFVETDGPIHDEWPPASHRALWGATPRRPIDGVVGQPHPNAHLDLPPARAAEELEKKDEVAPIPPPIAATQELAPDSPSEAAERLLRDFIERACRRPVADADSAPFVELARSWLDQGASFEDAMRTAYKAVLTSPAFLFHNASLSASDGRLADFELAERLAFFLWNSAPDAALRAKARSGVLDAPAGLVAEFDRMLADPKSNRFIEHFLDQWLDLRLIDFTTPDSDLYPEFDPLLEWSMLEETRAFVRELIDRDASVANLIDSDFAFVNSRLAKHYRLPAVDHVDVRRVELPRDSIRGGLLTQASVLKVTANGTTTSPVVRGAWVMDRIFGDPPPPPPPGTPAIEPDIRGATTVREQLEAHRQEPVCASCHAKFDPPGMALEAFDVIGGWRAGYRVLDPQKTTPEAKLEYDMFGYRPDTPPNVRYRIGAAVDASAELADGRAFEDVHGLKRLLLGDTRQVARSLAEKLLIYATGARTSFADRREIERIVDAAEAHDYGARTILEQVVLSEAFHRK